MQPAGRTTSTFFQNLDQIQTYLREQMPVWKQHHAGVEEMHGKLKCTLRGDHIVAEFIAILNDYVERHYAEKTLESVGAESLLGSRGLVCISHKQTVAEPDPTEISGLAYLPVETRC